MGYTTKGGRRRLKGPFSSHVIYYYYYLCRRGWVNDDETTLRCIFSQLPSHCRPKIIQKKKTKPKAVRVRNRHAGKQNEATQKRPSGNKRKKRHASQENIQHPRHKSMSHRFNLETTKTRVKHWEGGRQEDLFIYLFKNGFRISTKDVLVVFRLVFIFFFFPPQDSFH